MSHYCFFISYVMCAASEDSDQPALRSIHVKGTFFDITAQIFSVRAFYGD